MTSQNTRKDLPLMLQTSMATLIALSSTLSASETKTQTARKLPFDIPSLGEEEEATIKTTEEDFASITSSSTIFGSQSRMSPNLYEGFLGTVGGAGTIGLVETTTRKSSSIGPIPVPFSENTSISENYDVSGSIDIRLGYCFPMERDFNVGAMVVGVVELVNAQQRSNGGVVGLVNKTLNDDGLVGSGQLGLVWNPDRELLIVRTGFSVRGQLFDNNSEGELVFFIPTIQDTDEQEPVSIKLTKSQKDSGIVAQSTTIGNSVTLSGSINFLL